MLGRIVRALDEGRLAEFLRSRPQAQHKWSKELTISAAKNPTIAAVRQVKQSVSRELR